LNLFFIILIYMNRGKVILASMLGVAVLGVGAIVPIAVFAQTQDSTGSSFVQRLANKLGLDQSVVETAVDDVHEEIEAEMEAERAAAINQAVTDGKLTQRQADILNAVNDAHEGLRDEVRPVDIKENFEDMTQAEREAQMDTMKAEMDQKLLDAVNANGLNATTEEIQAAHEAAREAGVMKMVKFEMGVRTGKGMGPGMFIERL
jgi:hypothetical protein